MAERNTKKKHSVSILTDMSHNFSENVSFAFPFSLNKI